MIQCININVPILIGATNFGVAMGIGSDVIYNFNQKVFLKKCHAEGFIVGGAATPVQSIENFTMTLRMLDVSMNPLPVMGGTITDNSGGVVSGAAFNTAIAIGKGYQIDLDTPDVSGISINNIVGTLKSTITADGIIAFRILFEYELQKTEF